MKKSRGQSIIDFAVIALLAVGIIIFGIYKFGDNIADYFTRNSVESKFNSARTVKFERPQDIASNIQVNFDGITLVPPVEKVIEAGLAGGSYIQTSGSAGRIAEMGKIMGAYVDEIKKLTGGIPGAEPLETLLDDYKNDIDSFLTQHDGFVQDQALQKKLNMIEMALSVGSSSSDIQNAAAAFLPITDKPVRSSIINTFVNDLLNFDNSIDYFIDPYLYIEHLDEEKKEDKAQDQRLINKLQAEAVAMSKAERQAIAGQLKIFYGGGYSTASPSAYNGERMCHTFGGTTVNNICTIPETRS